MKRLFLILSLFIFISNSNGQIKPIGIEQAKIDSLLSKYHLEGIKIFIKKLGQISIKQNKIALKRNDMNNKLKITVEKSFSLSESGFGAKVDYHIKNHFIIRGESFQRNWGQQSGIGLLLRFEY